MESAVAYFITFTTYGEFLHGDARGSVWRGRSGPSERLEPIPELVAFEGAQMTGPSVRLNDLQRQCVATAISDVCAFKGWALHALNVRTNHVHIVVSASDSTPESVMNTCKAWATRRLRETVWQWPGTRSGRVMAARATSKLKLTSSRCVAM